MNLTNLVSLFLDHYIIYYKLSKFSLKTKLNKHLQFTGNWKTPFYCAAYSVRLGSPRLPARAQSQQLAWPARRREQRPNTGGPQRSPFAAGALAKEPSHITLFIKLTRHYYTESLVFHLQPSPFLSSPWPRPPATVCAPARWRGHRTATSATPEPPILI